VGTQAHAGHSIAFNTFLHFVTCNLDLRPFDLIFYGERGIVMVYGVVWQVWCVCSVKTVWSIPERFRGELLTMRRYTNLSSFTFTCLLWWTPCAKFGDFSFSRFRFIVRTDRQTEWENHGHTDAGDRFTHVTILLAWIITCLYTWYKYRSGKDKWWCATNLKG